MSQTLAGIYVSREPAKEADALARKIGVSRSGLYAMALREFVRRRENASPPQRINDAHEEPNPEEETLFEGAKRHSRRALDPRQVEG